MCVCVCMGVCVLKLKVHIKFLSPSLLPSSKVNCTRSHTQSFSCAAKQPLDFHRGWGRGQRLSNKDEKSGNEGYYYAGRF